MWRECHHHFLLRGASNNGRSRCGHIIININSRYNYSYIIISYIISGRYSNRNNNYKYKSIIIKSKNRNNKNIIRDRRNKYKIKRNNKYKINIIINIIEYIIYNIISIFSRTLSCKGDVDVVVFFLFLAFCIYDFLFFSLVGQRYFKFCEIASVFQKSFPHLIIFNIYVELNIFQDIF